ncbi:uncharacterized protein LOC123268792 [Cotesia glomerata]|uniref:uncharacterized protein LOC123268792 n=1 Tax=Cotesia glomerata TaxID=32391 RepID=UPI001D01281F|nr:uncharacterized protein LOC123268792 [Cotesia glomerata]
MDDKMTVKKSALQLEKGDSESKIVSTSQQQQQLCHNEKAFVQLQYYLLWLMRTEKRMHDTNESNFQFWSLVSSHYLTTCNNLMKVVNADFGYCLSLQGIYI